MIKALSDPCLLQSQNLIDAILSYNRTDRWNFDGLAYFLDEDLTDEEKSAFYDNILPAMCKLALQLPQVLTKPMPLLQRRKSQKITLSQHQIASLLANAFFCTFPKRNSRGKRSEYASYPSINFNSLFAKANDEKQMEKLKCLIHYFRKRFDAGTSCAGQGLVTFSRRALSDEQLPCWKKSHKKILRLKVDSNGTIEDEANQGMLEVNW